jgi:hypothetical protein
MQVRSYWKVDLMPQLLSNFQLRPFYPPLAIVRQSWQSTLKATVDPSYKNGCLNLVLALNQLYLVLMKI